MFQPIPSNWVMRFNALLAERASVFVRSVHRPALLGKRIYLLICTIALLASATNVSAAPPGKPRSLGNVFTWGYNGFGQLGNGTTADNPTPAVVSNLNGVVAVAGGHLHTLALKSDGTVWAWGSNTYGQLGNGTTTESAMPVQVSGLAGIVALAAYDHSLALKSDGTVWVWGSNAFGQLGNGTTTNSPSPTPIMVSGLTGIIAIAGGAGHSLALRSDGTIWTWGANQHGQLGTGTATNSLTPIQVPGISGVISLSAGAWDSLALKSDGTVWNWGTVEPGVIGTFSSNSPVQVTGLPSIASITAGFSHFLALATDGTVWAWGDDTNGELGNGTTNFTPTTTPVQVSGLSGVAAVSAGGFYSLALKDDGTVWSWGSAAPVSNSLTPLQGPGLNGVSTISAGYAHGLALQSQAIGAAWGYNGFGILANNTATNSDMPLAINNLSGLKAISGYQDFGLALSSDGTAWSWGYNGVGELGNPTNANTGTLVTTPVQVSNITGVIAVSAGNGFGLALRSDGTVWSWGANNDGQLGTGNNTYSTTPVQVTSLSGITAISAGNVHSLALRSDGTVWGWGYNFYGVLGNGTQTTSNSPVQVSNLSNVIAIAAGFAHSFALKSDGTVWAWGDNNYGELGTGATNTAPVTTPVQVSGLSNVVALSGGYDDGMALKSDGTVWTWGCNYYCYFNAPGLGSLAPVQVSALSGAIAISAGFDHSAVLLGDGSLAAWGSNSWGQLGNCSTIDSVTPVRVGNLSGAAAIAGYHQFSLALASPSSSLGGVCIAAPPDTTLYFGQTVSLGVTAAGSPLPSIIETGGLPNGLSFTDNGNGTGAVSGTVGLGAIGTYYLSFTAQNGVAPNVTETTTLSVVQAASTTSLIASPNPAYSGQALTMTASVASVAQGLGTPTGSITFFDGTTLIGSAALNSSGSAALSTSSLSLGSHSLTAVYSGDSNFSGSTSSSVQLTVQSAPAQPNGNVWAWGQYGFLFGLFSNDPTLISNLSGVTTLAAGWNHSLALKSDGTVWAWGSNLYGELGNGSTSCIPTDVASCHNSGTNTPAQVMNLSSVTAITAGSDISAALKNDGTVWTWGSNLFGALGDGLTSDSLNNNDSYTPVQVLIPSGMTAISAGSSHMLALKGDGSVWSWGWNSNGQLGNGSTTDSNKPVQVSGLTGITAVSGGATHSLALKNDGTVWAWGSNSNGELGNGSQSDSSVPVQVTGLAGVAAIAAGDDFSLALKNDGTVWAWGSNGSGELGNGNTSPSSTPVQVSNLGGITAIAAGFNHSLALKSDSSVWEWGYEVSNGPVLSTSTPVPVNAACGIGFKAVAAGQFYNLALSLSSLTAAPCITSPDSAAYLEGQPFSITVTTSGTPTPSLTEAGVLPTGVTFVDNGNGTGTLAGTAPSGTAGSYSFSFIAQNGVPPSATQVFTLVIGQVGTGTNGSGSNSSTGSTGNGTNGNNPNACGCTAMGNYVSPAAPVTAGKTVAPVSNLTVDPNQISFNQVIDVTTSAPNGISPAQVATFTGGIATGDPVATIKVPNPTAAIDYNGRYRVIQLGDQTHDAAHFYKAQSEDPTQSAIALGDQPATSGTSSVVRNPLVSSPNGNPKYTVVESIPYNSVTGLQATYYSTFKILTASGVDVTPAAINTGSLPNTTHWDFSPDEDRLYLDSVDPTSGSPCTENMAVYDLTTGNLIASYAATVAASRAQFSPSGKFLVYTTNEYSSGCPAIGVIPPSPNNVHLQIWRLWNVGGNAAQNLPIYATTYLFGTGVTPNEDQAFGGEGSWGFSPDYPETSFVYAFANTANSIEWDLANLSTGSLVASYPSVPTSTAVSPTNRNISLVAFWQFDKCADVAALVIPNPANQTQSEVFLYDTSTGALLAQPQTQSAAPSSITLVSATKGQEVQVNGGAPVPLVSVTCGKLNTPTGSNVEVRPKDSGTSNAPVDLTFSNVTQAGTTSVTSSNQGPTPAAPTAFKLGTPPIFYDVTVSKSLQFSGSITICINYTGFAYVNPSAIRLYHFQNGAWVDVTTSNNPNTMTACGVVNSFSPFGLFEPAGPVPANIAATGGTPQSAQSGTALATPLQATVTDNNGNPIPGIPVTFAAPVGGATGGFSGATFAFVTTDSSGVATAPPFTADGTQGSYIVTASVNGLSTTANFLLTNLKSATTLSFTSSASPATYGAPVTLTATVLSGAGAPTGTVAFSDGNALLGTVPLTGSIAALTTSSLAVGAHSLTASYSGDNNFVSSTSTLALTVNPAPLSIAANNASRQYGAKDPAFTVSYSGFVNGDTAAALTGTLLCTAGDTASSPTGAYAINCSGLSSLNYIIAYAPGTLTITPAALTITANSLTKVLNAANPALTWTASGFVNGDTANVFTANPTCTTAATTNSTIGSYPVTCAGAAAANYTFSYDVGTLKIQYATNVGHMIQPPIAADGTSVFNQGRTVPAKFSIYNANGVSIGTPGVVSSFYLTRILSGTTSTTVENVVDTSNPDTAFRWDPVGQQWIFNITTSNLTAGRTYIYTIGLNDGSTIVFQYGLK